MRERGQAVDYASMTLADLRALAQTKKIRVQGKRPSLCSKAELIPALKVAVG
jgi:hypothetical protein